jgi:hypothetical protein
MTALPHITEWTNMELPDLFILKTTGSQASYAWYMLEVTQLSEPHGQRAGKSATKSLTLM